MDLVMERATQRADEIRAATATQEHRGEGKTA
jgi:hypothetical protein